MSSSDGREGTDSEPMCAESPETTKSGSPRTVKLNKRRLSETSKIGLPISKDNWMSKT